MSHWAKPRMTVDEAARALYELWGCTEPRHMDEHVRAILRGVESAALERIAEAFSVGTSVTHRPIHPQDVADRIRHMNRDR